MLDIDNGMSLIKDTVACGGVKEPPIGSSWIGKKKSMPCAMENNSSPCTISSPAYQSNYRDKG